MSTTTSPAAVASAAIEAFTAADWDTLADICSPEVVYTETGTGRRLEGVEECFAAWREWREAMPDLAGTVERSLEDGDLAALDLTWRGTHDGPLVTPTGTIPATGRPVLLRSTQWVTVRDGRSRHIDHHLDVLGLLAQIGALPG